LQTAIANRSDEPSAYTRDLHPLLFRPWRLQSQLSKRRGLAAAARRVADLAAFAVPQVWHRLAWYDNVPGNWLADAEGKCRYCGEPISPRYPIVEFISGAMFRLLLRRVFYLSAGAVRAASGDDADELGFRHPRLLNIVSDWPIYGCTCILLASLLAASLIDLETFTIPAPIFWWAAGVGIVMHAIVDNPTVPGALEVGPVGAAMSIGGAMGLLHPASGSPCANNSAQFRQGGPVAGNR